MGYVSFREGIYSDKLSLPLTKKLHIVCTVSFFLEVAWS